MNNESVAKYIELPLDLFGLYLNILGWSLVFGSLTIPLHFYVYEFKDFSLWLEQGQLGFQLTAHIFISLLLGFFFCWLSKAFIARRKTRLIITGFLLINIAIFLAYLVMQVVYFGELYFEGFNAFIMVLITSISLCAGVLAMVAGFLMSASTKTNGS